MLTLIFVREDPENIIDRTIAAFSKGEYCHVAIQFPWGIVESLGIPGMGLLPGVRVSSTDKYDGANILSIDVDLPNQAAAEQKARRLIGKFYSYIGCFEGGAFDLTGMNLHSWIGKVFNWIVAKCLGVPIKIDTGEWTMNCSETATRIIRAGGLEILPGVDADCVTPMDLVRYFEETKEGVITMGDETMVAATDDVLAAKEPAGNAARVVSATVSTLIDTAAITGSTSVTNWISEEIGKLRAEMKSTSSFTVAARDRLEIAALEAMSVVALAELKNLTVKLKDKVS